MQEKFAKKYLIEQKIYSFPILEQAVIFKFNMWFLNTISLK